VSRAARELDPELAAARAGSLRWPRLWNVLGWLLLAAIAVGSLIPMPAMLESPVPGADKFQHLLGYFLLTFWHGQLGLPQSRYLLRAGGFLLAGALIEVLQAQTGWRSGDLRDLAANAVGIVFGLVIAGGQGNWLARTEARLERLALRRGWIAPRSVPQPQPEPAGD
jgi:VanZ family protein